MKRVALHTLGCKLNYAETSSIGRAFSDRGYQVVGPQERADVVVLNTCTVTDRADRECRQLVRRALRRSPNAYVVVAGCYAELQPESLAAIDGVDLVLGTKEKFDLFSFAGEFRKRERPGIFVQGVRNQTSAEPARSAASGDRTRAFLKIQDGCDYTCSFCTIPRARGASRSVPAEDVVRQAGVLVDEGFREIVLTGVNVGDYGRSWGSSLLSLLRSLVGIGGLDRIRISSVEPNLLDDALLAFWLEEPKLCRHFHIPLQSGSDTVLRRMRRRYRTTWYADRLRRIVAGAPDAGIGADVIVGFPGETDGEFEETFEFLRDQPVSYLHVFTYSERSGTPASAHPGTVEPRVRAMRSERLRSLSIRKRSLFNGSFIGREVGVLFEGRSRSGTATGLTGQYVRVDVPTTLDLANSIRTVRISAANDESCVGSIMESVRGRSS